MDISQIQQPLNQFLQAVSQDIQIDQLILFGSYLEGNAGPDSDIDVVVVSENFRTIDPFDRSRLLDKAAGDIAPEIQAWGFTPEELEAADELTTLGYARTAGVRII
jgi:predicted nucleotidyltransferase